MPSTITSQSKSTKQPNTESTPNEITQYYYPDPVNQQVIQQWLFMDLLWQQPTWQYLTTHLHALPHAMLFAGNAGTGKRAFVYRFVAWALCGNQRTQCTRCHNCLWAMPKPSNG
ncbi:MAG: hypothetical protein U1E91_06290 [Moraxella sp.]